MEMLHNFIHINYTTILLVLFMLVFVLSNVSFDKRTTRLFMMAIGISLVLVIVDSIESYTATWSKPSNLRILMSAIGYTLRPMSIMSVLLIITRNRMINRWLIYLPMIINTIVSFSAFFCDFAYSYDENNEFVRGPLGISAYVVSALYLIMLCWLSVQYIKEKSYSEGMIVFAITFTSMMSIFLEVMFAFEGFINACIAVSVTFYYMYYLVLRLKRDPLTRVINRHYFDIDVARNNDKISAVINIDLNDLKVINDTMGHESGDKALIAITQCIRGRMLRKCKLYRIGGDEFCVLYFGKNISIDAILSKMIVEINKDIQSAGYTCAMGLAIRDADEDLKTLFKRADRIMYENKAKMKEEM